MGIQSVRSGLQKTTMLFVSTIMAVSLALPIPVLADSPGPNETTQSTATKTATPGENTDVTQSGTNTSPEQSTSSTTQASRAAPSDTSQQPSLLSTPSTNTATNQPHTNTYVDSTAPASQSTSKTDTSISNAVNSQAASGNAGASQNTTVGNVTTGNADALATIVNLLQSNVNINGAQPITFIQDVTGTVDGDLVIDPAALASLGAYADLFGNTSNPDASIDSSTQGSINNALNIHAASGSANAYQNTTVGAVQSGDAHAIANVVNLINSSVSAGQSFVGMINIYGDLQGNILVPESFVNSILGTGSAVDHTTGPIITTDNNASVVNNVNTTATSGTASVADNTKTGTVSSGKADTNVTILNLTSNQTVGKNALLVFVNVLGSWVGLILDAPAGTTSANLGDGAASQTANNSPNTIDSTTNYQITNTINTAAQSGNASANQNTTVGNISSGDASAGANILNILNSQISLSDWFGILFINVFGTWNGNFGVQTAVIIPSNNSSGSGSGSSHSGGTGSGSAPALLTFTPSQSQGRTHRAKPLYAAAITPTTFGTTTYDSQYAPLGEAYGVVLNTTTKNSSKHNSGLQTNKDLAEKSQNLEWWVPVLGILVLLALFGSRRYAMHRRQDSTDEEI